LIVLKFVPAKFRRKLLFSPRRKCASSYKFRSNFRARPTSFTRAGSAVSYSYDANSNRLSSTDTTTSDTDLDGDFDASDLQRTTAQALSIAQDSNRLLGFTQTNTTQKLNSKGKPTTHSTSTQVSYGLDATGNLTSDGLRAFSYDTSNRLSQVQVGAGDEASKVVYLHNALGQRVFKSEPQVAQTAPNEAELGTDFITWLKQNFNWLFAKAQANATLGQSFVYADGPLGRYNLLGEYGNGGAKSAGRIEYLYLPTETGQAQLIGLYRGGRFYAVHTDHLGTPRQITDDTNKVVWQWAYSGFGDNKPTGILKATTNPKQAITNQPTLLKASNPAFAVNLRFPGQYFDSESNLSYNYFRSYDARIRGGYVQPDPTGLAGGWSRFGYVGGNPFRAIDPRGLKTCVLVTKNSIGFRDHAALYLSSGGGKNGRSAFLYDPSGSYAISHHGGSGDYVEGAYADIEKFTKFHNESEVEVVCQETPSSEELRIVEKIIDMDSPGVAQCSKYVSTALDGSPFFPKVRAGTIFPGNLYRNAGGK
jgi:RHS repeat-associated protein